MSELVSRLAFILSPRFAFALSLIAVGLTLIVISLGAWTRLTDAGLGCPDWPGCYGYLLVPQSEADIQQAQIRYPHSPVDSFKAGVEMTHRYAAGLLGLVVLLLGVLATRLRNRPGYPGALIATLVVLIILQAAAGALTVTLKLWPQVVTAHLLGGFLTLGLLVLLAFRLSGRGEPLRPLVIRKRLKLAQVLAVTGLVLVLGQIMLGGWTSANYAALACPDFPICQGRWWPDADFAEGFDFGQQIGPNYLGGQLQTEARIAIHLAHRIGAVILSLYLTLMVILFWRWQLSRRWCFAVMVILLIQLSLGVANILLSLPISVATAHNGFAAFLFVVMLILSDRLLQSNASIRKV